MGVQVQMWRLFMPTVLALTIHEAAKAAGIGRSSLYEEIANGRLQARKLGRRTLILVEDLNRWLSTLPLTHDVRPEGMPSASATGSFSISRAKKA